MKATDCWGTGDGIAWNGGRRGTGFFFAETRNAKREMLKCKTLKRRNAKYRNANSKIIKKGLKLLGA